MFLQYLFRRCWFILFISRGFVRDDVTDITTMKYLFITLTLLLFVCSANGQDTLRTYDKSVVVVVVDRVRTQASGVKVLTFDSSLIARYNDRNIGDLLASHSPIFVKNYGPGNLSTTTFRGGNAAHTAVIWGGLNINSSMNGIVDFNLLPTYLFDQVALQFGGGGTSWGSGAVSGAVLLDSKMKFNNGRSITAGSSIGAFGFRQTGVKAQWSSDSTIWNLGAYYTDSENNFTYQRSDTASKERMDHASFIQRGIKIDHSRKLRGKKGILSVRYWYHENFRDVPPTLNEQTSSAFQYDLTSRLAWQLQKEAFGGFLVIRQGWFLERINFKINDYRKIEHNVANTLISDIEFNRYLAKWKWHAGVNHTISMGNSKSYSGSPMINRISLFGGAIIKLSNRWEGSMNLRSELVNNQFAPLTFAVGSEYRVNPLLSFLVNASRVYRVPTFNDLYWNPGGNPELLTELGYTGDATTVLNIRPFRSKFKSKIEITVFTRLMKNQIIWLPQGAFWTPRNLMEVWSRGMETNWTLSFTNKNFSVLTGVGTNYTLAASMKPLSENDQSVDQQLMYVPMYSGNGNILICYKQFEFNYTLTYTGYRYISTDRYSYLNPYWLHSSFVSYAIEERNNMIIRLNGSLDNITNTTYQIVQGRPMPLRGFRIGASITCNNK
jgi:iron complex outermembrane receptor protein